MAAAAPIALAMQVAGGVISGIQAKKAANVQAGIDDENARLTLLDGEQQAMQTRHDERMQAGAMLAGMAGDGVQLGSGSAADMLAESAYQGELETLNIRTRATRQANNLYQAADDKRAEGRNAIINGIFGATATAIRGVSDIRARNTLASAEQQARAPRPMIMGVSR